MTASAQQTTTSTEGGLRTLVAVAVPTFGLALASTVVTTFMPVLLNQISGPMVTGLLIGCEGFFGLWVPLVVGSLSDSLGSRLGHRLPFLIAAAPAMAAALVLMPLVGSLLPIIPLLAVFFAAYFAYYTPYRAVYPDIVPNELSGRSQGVQKTLREGGLGVALIAGGFLLAVWRPLPFIVAALVLASTTTAFVVWMMRARPRAGGGSQDGHAESLRSRVRGIRELLRDHPAIRWVVAGNAMWEGTIAALKTFVVLYITVGLGRSTTVASVVLAIVAVTAVGGALTGGWLADRVGHLPLMRVAVVVYGVGALVPLFVHSLLAIVAVVPVAFAAAMVMTLPYSMLMRVAPDDDHGLTAGVFDTSRGAGSIIGPVAAGVAITLLRPVLTDTHGFAAMFLVVSVLCFTSLYCLRRLRRYERR